MLEPGDLSSWVGLGIATVTAILGLLTYKRSVDLQREAVNDAKKLQASKVYAWLDLPYTPVIWDDQYSDLPDWIHRNVTTASGTNTRYSVRSCPTIHVENASGAPVRVLDISINWVGIVDSRLVSGSSLAPETWQLINGYFGINGGAGPFESEILFVSHWAPDSDQVSVPAFPGLDLSQQRPWLPSGHVPAQQELDEALTFVVGCFANSPTHPYRRDALVSIFAEVASVDLVDSYGRAWHHEIGAGIKPLSNTHT